MLKLKTLKLQEMVSKAVKGASNNKLIPITSLMAIELKDGVLTLTTTDATNTLKIKEKDITGDDFYVVVQVDLFSKLVMKTTVETISLLLKESSLEVKGNGTYNIDLPLDEEGKLVRFPAYKFNTNAPSTTMHASSIKSILNTNKAALAETMEIPCLTGYYFGDNVITTDTYKVCCNAENIFNSDILLPAELVNLLSLINQEKITVQQDNGKILFTTENVTIYGVKLDGIEDYPVDSIMSYVNTDFSSNCKLPKAALISVLDRLMLFVTPYDKNGIYLTFTNEGLVIDSKKSTGTELIKYQASENFTPFTCCADVELFRTQLVAQEGEVTELWYGHEKALKMVSGKITQIISLLEDDRSI